MKTEKQLNIMTINELREHKKELGVNIGKLKSNLKETESHAQYLRMRQYEKELAMTCEILKKKEHT